MIFKILSLLFLTTTVFASDRILHAQKNINGLGVFYFPSSTPSPYGACVFDGSSIPGSVSAGSSGNVLTSNGTTWISSTPAAGGVSSVTASAPVVSSGGATPNISMHVTDATHDGYLNQGDWSTFNSKETAISSGSTSQYWRGDKSFQTLNAAAIPDFQSSVSSNTDVAANTSSRHGAVTIGTANGLSLSTQALSLQLSSATQPGALSSSDWSTFNNKQSSGSYVVTSRNINTTAPITGGGDLSSDRTIAIPSSSTSVNGYLSSTDWNIFNSKEPSISAGTTAQYFRGDKTFQNLASDVQTAAKNGTAASILYVAGDIGNDSNDGSILKPYKTIQAAINAANSIASYKKQAVIYVSPTNGSGQYTENLTLSQQGINLICSSPFAGGRGCYVNGTLTVNLTGTAGGANFQASTNEDYVYGFVFASGSSDALTFSGSIYQKIIMQNCYVVPGAARAAVITNTGTTSGTPSQVLSIDTVWENNSATIEAIRLTAGRFWNYGSIGSIQVDQTAAPSVIQDGPSSFIANLVTITGQYQLTDNTATATFNLSTIASGTAACISTPSTPNTGYALLAYFGCNSTNTNSIIGSGVVVNAPGNVRFGTSGDIIGTVTQTVLGPGFPQGEVIIGAGAVTGTNVALSIKGGHVKNTQTTAPTATVNANAGTAATCTLSNASDAAGKINLTTTATAPAAGVQCTVTFNKAYGVAPICTIGPNNNNSVLFAVANGIFVTTTTTTLVINYANADTLGHANVYMYSCMETQ